MRKTTQTLIMGAAMMSSVITGCSENDLVEQTPKGGAVTLTTTISLDGSSATTRALDADGKKTFAAGEQIALVYEDANNGVQKIISAKLKAENISSDKKTASFSFSFDKAPKDNGNFTMIYPASMAKEPLPTSGEFGDIAAPNYTGLGNQDGTLASLSSKLDLAYYESNFTNATFPSGIQLSNKLAILELTSITDYTGTNDLTSTITGLSVKVGTGASAPTYTVARTAAAGPIYVAMQPCSESDITITATTSTANYEKTVTSQSLAASTMTPVTAKMWKVVDLSTLTSAYEVKNGEMLKGKHPDSGVIFIEIADGATVTLKDLTIDKSAGGLSAPGLSCLGDATIILEGKNKVKAFNDQSGIWVATNKTLTITGDGSLEAIGRGCGAGIGSGSTSCGNIVISGGTVIAEGSQNAAGIGSGDEGCGNITINGGIVKATGGENAAGIGSAYTYNSRCGNITISGGTIELAQGGDYAAGIGSGKEGQCGVIEISGGTITSAQGGTNGAGIGSGKDGICGDIEISGSTTLITSAKGGSGGAGIGSGTKTINHSSIKCGDIKISGGTIKKVQGGSELDSYGAGIGGGKKGTCGNITISGGIIIEAQGGSGEYGGAAGIGSGTDTGATCGDISISGGTIFIATGGTDAAGIGSGHGGKCDKITISGGTIEGAQGGQRGAGIGSGYNGTCGDITITTGVTQVTAHKGTGAPNSIGSGNNGTCGTVTIEAGANVTQY